jgi:hypothetical protein
MKGAAQLSPSPSGEGFGEGLVAVSAVEGSRRRTFPSPTPPLKGRGFR